MKCRVYGCQSEAVVEFCGKHEEDLEDGVRLRLPVGRPKGSKTAFVPFPSPRRAPQCSARTKKGSERCHNGAIPGSDLCRIHHSLAGKGAS